VRYGWTFRQSDVSDIAVVDSTVAKALEDVDVSSLSIMSIHDSRDDIFAPERGTASRIGVEWGDHVIGSDLDFIRARWSHAWFTPLLDDGVLALSLRTGVIVPVGSTDVIPLQERFYNGGENTVRSFKEDELGPKDSKGNPLGGEAFTVLSAEWRRPIEGDLEGALFVDLGNVEPDHSDYLRFADFESAIGYGLRYHLPVGPVRLDFAINPSPGEDEDSFVIHFAVGMPF
jgi:outer membrane protein assembly factor BamA